MTADPASQLLFLEGEELLCTFCGSSLAVVLHDIFDDDNFDAAMKLGHGGYWYRGALLCRCGGGTAPTPAGRKEIDVREHPAPRVFVRSGDWVGWREIGGE